MFIRSTIFAVFKCGGTLFGNHDVTVGSSQRQGINVVNIVDSPNPLSISVPCRFESYRNIGAWHRSHQAPVVFWILHYVRKGETSLVEGPRENVLEWLYSSLETLKIKEQATVRASECKRRQTEGRVSLRDFLSLPLLEKDGPLRTLHLTNRTGAQMRLDILSFVGTGEGNVATINRARELFQIQSRVVPQALWGLYYIRDGERSAGYGWEKPFLDEVFVHIRP